MKKILQKIKCFMGLHEIEVQKISRPLKTYPKDAETHCIKIRDKTGLGGRHPDLVLMDDPVTEQKV